MEKVDNVSLQKKRGKTFDNNATVGAKKSINNIKQIVAKDQTNLIVLTNERSTKKNILDTISYIGKRIESTDTFLVYFVGHGYQVADENGDELDKFDEVLVVYNDYLVDDEINLLLKNYFSKTNNLMLIDACHSGSMNKINLYFDFNIEASPDYFKDNKSALALLNENDICESGNVINSDEPYNLIYFGATNDNNIIKGVSNGGIIAYFLCEIMTKVRQNPILLKKYTYRQLACDLSNIMIEQEDHKELQFHEFGKAVRNSSTAIPFEFN